MTTRNISRTCNKPLCQICFFFPFLPNLLTNNVCYFYFFLSVEITLALCHILYNLYLYSQSFSFSMRCIGFWNSGTVPTFLTPWLVISQLLFLLPRHQPFPRLSARLLPSRHVSSALSWQGCVCDAAGRRLSQLSHSSGAEKLRSPACELRQTHNSYPMTAVLQRCSTSPPKP